MGKLIPFLFIALDGKSAVAHLRLRIPGHKLRGSWFGLFRQLVPDVHRVCGHVLSARMADGEAWNQGIEDEADDLSGEIPACACSDKSQFEASSRGIQ